MSETAAARHILAEYCQGMGLDLGFGGSSISETAINVDQANQYTQVGTDPRHLTGDARNLYWFKDGVLDFVYSSHLLEDYPPYETLLVCKEWLRVIKPDGRLVLLLPDEPVFREHCAKTGQMYNNNHRNHELTLEWFKANIAVNLPVYIEFELSPLNIYSFAIVLRKL